MISSKTTIMMPTFNICNVFKLLLLAFALAIFPFTCEAKIYLLSIGISNYPGTKNDLRLPHNDAATMQWLYKENQQAKVCLLMNDKAKVATVKKALQKMVSIATADDIVVMFFSGHGIKGGFVCYDGFLYYSDIYSAMASFKSKNKMVFADACFSGAMRQGKSNTYASSNSNNTNNVMFFLSCRSNEKSIETPSMTNGFFTYALQHGLRGGADKNRDRIITAKELFDYVSTKVKKESGNRQHPVMWGKFSNNMPVMKWQDHNKKKK